MVGGFLCHQSRYHISMDAERHQQPDRRRGARIMAVRFTKVAGEVLRDASPAPRLRVTKSATEIVRAADIVPRFRASKLAAEVLRSAGAVRNLRVSKLS